MNPFLRPLRILALVLPVSLALYGSACSSDDSTTPPADEENPELADVVYEGGANDEALEILADATPTQVAGKGAVFDAPVEAAVLPKATAPTFTWHTGTSTGWLSPSAPRERQASRARTAWAPLAELLGGERSAHAHGAPVNGAAYFLVLSTPADAKLVRVFTTNASFTPDAATWDKIKAAGGTITATVTTGIFDENALASDGGPFAGTPVTFTVAP